MMEWVIIVKEVTERKEITERELFCEKLRKNEEIYRIIMKQTEQLVYE